MTKPLTYTDVFVPGGFPRHTYNPRLELKLEDQIRSSTENLCKLVTVTGQTKAGKTVSVRKVLPREDSIWIDGGTVGSEDDLWDVVQTHIDAFTDTSVETGKETTSSASGSFTASGSLFVVKGESEVGAEISRTRASGVEQSRSVSSRVAALMALSKDPLPLVIDDFHYLPKELQGSIVRALKPLIFDGLPVVVIAIPHRRYDAVKVEKEMTGRILPVSIPIWSANELEFISNTGFGLLSFTVPTSITNRLTDEAIGSPHLMQDFCRTLCKRVGIERAPTPTPLHVSTEQIEDVFRDIADTIGKPIFEKLARGPRSRTDRLQRGLRTGDKVDIYELVLHALAHMRPGLVSIEYEELRAAIREVSSTQIPQLHEVSRVLRHMSTIAATDQSSTPVIDFDDDDKKLHITDPFFAFYLRWGDLSR
jgi:hypothetical protein